jgi:hypothetical protein
MMSSLIEGNVTVRPLMAPALASIRPGRRLYTPLAKGNSDPLPPRRKSARGLQQPKFLRPACAPAGSPRSRVLRDTDIGAQLVHPLHAAEMYERQ